MTILYVRYVAGYYLTTWNGEGRLADSHYFRRGEDTLFDRFPTRFDTRADAVAAAEEMGFTVLNG